ncbi:MAG UNVERIFIED_CONTAM: hypothetical protein LVQ98_00605 [Rickettsiaceae bacterium]
MQELLGVGVGDNVKLISSQMISTAFGSIPRAKDFTVVAIFSSGLYDFDAGTIIMNQEAALTFLSLTNINLIEVSTNRPNDSMSLSTTILKKLPHDVNITNWQIQFSRKFLNALKVERIAMTTILSLIILVAAFNIYLKLIYFGKR